MPYYYFQWGYEAKIPSHRNFAPPSLWFDRGTTEYHWLPFCTLGDHNNLLCDYCWTRNRTSPHITDKKLLCQCFGFLEGNLLSRFLLLGFLTTDSSCLQAHLGLSLQLTHGSAQLFRNQRLEIPIPHPSSCAQLQLWSGSCRGRFQDLFEDLVHSGALQVGALRMGNSGLASEVAVYSPLGNSWLQV